MWAAGGLSRDGFPSSSFPSQLLFCTQSTGSAQILPCRALGEHSSLFPKAPMGRVLSCTCLRKGCELLPGHGRAQGWQIPTPIQLQEKVFGCQGAATGPGGVAREETSALLVFTPCLLFLQRKTHSGASVFLLSGSVPSELLSQGSAGASFPGHTLDPSVVPPHWEGGSCPSLPLCSPRRAQRGTRSLGTRFSFIPAGSWLLLPFPSSLLQLTGCVAVLWWLSASAQEHLGVSS